MSPAAAILAALTATACLGAPPAPIEQPAPAVSAIACEPVLDQVVCITDNGTSRTVEWGPAEDSMATTVTESR